MRTSALPPKLLLPDSLLRSSQTCSSRPSLIVALVLLQTPSGTKGASVSSPTNLQACRQTQRCVVVVFPSIRGGSLPSVASVFTAELSAILLSLQIILTLQIYFIGFSDSRITLSAYESSVYARLLIFPEWLYVLGSWSCQV